MNYKNVCVRSKGALVVLAMSMLLTTTIIGLSTNFTDNYSYAIFAAIGLHYLSYPLLGLLGEKWMRYKVLLVGIILLFVGFFIGSMTYFGKEHAPYVTVVILVSVFLIIFPIILLFFQAEESHVFDKIPKPFQVDFRCCCLCNL